MNTNTTATFQKKAFRKLNAKLGDAGYGIYCKLRELILSEEDFAIEYDHQQLSVALGGSSVELIKSVVEDFGLFHPKAGDETQFTFAEGNPDKRTTEQNTPTKEKPKAKVVPPELSQKRREAVMVRWRKKLGNILKCDTNNTNDTNVYAQNTNIASLKAQTPIDTSVITLKKLPIAEAKASQTIQNDTNPLMRAQEHDHDLNNNIYNSYSSRSCSWGERKMQNTNLQNANARGAMTPPTLEELRAFVKAEGLTALDADKFHAYYSSRGWKRGDSPMISWRATAKQWNEKDLARQSAKASYTQTATNTQTRTTTDIYYHPNEAWGDRTFESLMASHQARIEEINKIGSYENSSWAGFNPEPLPTTSNFLNKQREAI